MVSSCCYRVRRDDVGVVSPKGAGFKNSCAIIYLSTTLLQFLDPPLLRVLRKSRKIAMILSWEDFA